MCTFKKKITRRISVWTLVFALVITLLTAFASLPAHAENFMGDVANGARDAVSDAGNAVSDMGDAASDAVSDMVTPDGDGTVEDSDGIIGNEDSETEPTEADREKKAGWIGVIIAILVIVLIIVLVPKKKDR